MWQPHLRNFGLVNGPSACGQLIARGCLSRANFSTRSAGALLCFSFIVGDFARLTTFFLAKVTWQGPIVTFCTAIKVRPVAGSRKRTQPVSDLEPLESVQTRIPVARIPVARIPVGRSQGHDQRRADPGLPKVRRRPQARHKQLKLSAWLLLLGHIFPILLTVV